MGNYYILSVDSYMDTFSAMDSAVAMNFSLQIQNHENVFDNVQTGDRFLVYRKSPVAKINMYFQVLRRNGDSLCLQKMLEVAGGVSVTPEQGKLELQVITEIDADRFQAICRQMVADFETAGEMPKADAERITGAENVLLYGVSGVGKSHEINRNYCGDARRMERVVFHPDYTYSDFVGQILPVVKKDKLEYRFTQGPFTRAMKTAWENPKEQYYLVIEELNRGNAPAIFGEIFQLLDRKSADDPGCVPEEYGESEYAISNPEIAEIVYGDREHGVRIPSNLWLIATINTADQNVFTMDTAFQRRWKMRCMKNDIWAAGHARQKIAGSQVSWGAFASVVNEVVVEMNRDMMITEDKRLGAYFVKSGELAAERFPEKVLKYLWDDVFQMDRDAMFAEDFRSLERVLERYEKTTEDKLAAVLKREVYQRMLRVTQETERQEDEPVFDT